MELKEKAKGLGIKKMPSNYTTLLKPRFSPKKRITLLQTKRSGVGELASSGKRRGMLEVLNETVKSTSPKKTWSSTPLKEDAEENADDFQDTSLDATFPVSKSRDKNLAEDSDGDNKLDADVNNLLETIFPKGKAAKESEDSSSSNDENEQKNKKKNEKEKNLVDLSDLSDSESADSTSKLVDENFALRASCKLSEKGRLKLLDEVKEKDLELANLKRALREKDEEVTSLKKKIQELPPSYKDSAEENKKLIQLIKAAQEFLQSGLKRSNARRSLSFESNGETTPLVKDMEKTHEEKKDEENKKSSTSGDKQNKKGKIPAEEGLSRSEYLAISEKVRKDILGEESMKANEDGKVDVGGGLVVDKSKWDKTIKTPKKYSLFVTKLGHNAYGSKALGSRTIGQPKETGKFMATPKKVDAIVACLRGKLLADNPSYPNVDAAANAARTILGRKMQDEARSEMRCSKKKI